MLQQMAWLLILQSLFPLLVFWTVAQQVIFEKNSTVPIKGSSLALSCKLSASFTVSSIIFKIKGKDIFCRADKYRCEFYNDGYTFTANMTGAFAVISRLDRISDESIWACEYNAEESTRSVLNIVVYTIPAGFTFTQEPNASVDLSITSVKLQCKTTSCMYPMASVQWLYQDESAPVTLVLFTTTNSSGTPETCQDQEQIYTSTLDIPIYTTLSDNSDKTVTFSCRIVYLDPSINIMATGQQRVRFAVRVTEAVLQQNNQNITDTLTVTSGELVTLTCVTATSRPTPIIDWYLGSQKKGSGASLTFIPADTDHNKTVYCQAYNINISRTVFSLKPSLFVQVRVTEAVLQQNKQNITDTLIVTSGELVTLTCVTTTSRPAPTIDWYLGSQKNGSGVSLTFTPSNADHSKTIYCQAYNINPFQLVSSLKPRLFVQVKVSEVTLAGLGSGTILFYEGYVQTLQCVSSPSRPIASIRWWLGNKQLTDNITNTNYTDTSGMYVLTSLASVILTRSNINQTIYCDGYISGQAEVNSSQHYIDVFYAPDVSVTVSGPSLQNVTLTVLCEARGHPAEYTFHSWKQMWGDKVIRSDLQGTPSANYSTLKLERLSLQDMGTYICSVDNNIRGIDGNITQAGDVDINVTGRPTVLKEEEFHFTGKVGDSINIFKPFYSNPAIQSFIFKKNGTELENSSRITMNLSNNITEYTFYGVPVELEVQLANLLIQNLTQDDFDSYTLILDNLWGRKEFRLQLEAAGSPLMVDIFNFNRFTEYQIEFHFKPGFNGGRIQTFIIEYKSSASPDSPWRNSSVTDLKETQTPNGTYYVNVTKPPPGNYEYRMYSWNEIGRSPYSVVITIFIPEDAVTKPSPPGLNVAAVAGGIGAAVLVISVVAVVIIFRKRRNKSNDTPIELNGRPEDINDHESGLKDNPVYETSGYRFGPSASNGTIVAEYTAVVKPKKKAALVEDPSNLYAQVEKTNKNGRKGAAKKKGKTSRGDIYQNIDQGGKSTYADSEYKNSRQARTETADENVYENPGGVVSNNPMVNKDGLLYADLMLDHPTSKNGKMVIRGIENHTEYAEIAYGKRGEPLPDNDDEKVHGDEQKKIDV